MSEFSAQAHEQGAGTSGVVPHPVVGELHGVRVLRLLKVLVGVTADVAAAADVSADETDPQVLRGGQQGGARGGRGG